MLEMQYKINAKDSPVLATAVHNGHSVRADVAQHLHINEFDRMLEEDPSTEYFTNIVPSSLIINTSRFEVDVNRPRETAIYRTLDQSWGLKVWKDQVPEDIWQDSLKQYDEFYRKLEEIVDTFLEQWGFLILLDIHSYNYRRDKKEADPHLNPEINIGTASMDRIYWAPLVDYFVDQLRSFNHFRKNFTIEENLRFKGGYMAKWLHDKYPRECCVLSIELKKIFMDERTGATDLNKIKKIRQGLSRAAYGLPERAAMIKKGR